MMRALFLALILLFSTQISGPLFAAALPTQEQEPPGEGELEEEVESAEEESLLEEESAQEVQISPVQASQLPLSPASNGLVFRFNNVPLTTLIETVMEELGYSYIIDPRVQGTASIHTMGEIPRENAFEILEQLLQMNGQGIVRQDGMYVILPLPLTTKIPHEVIVNPEVTSEPQEGVAQPPAEEQVPAVPGSGQLQPAPQPAQQAPSEPEQVVSTLSPPQEPGPDENQDEGVLTYVITLHHIPTSEMITMITPFISNGASVINYASANILIVTDFRQNVQQALKLIQLLDTEYFDITTVDLVPIRFNQAGDVAADLGHIFVPGAPAGVRLVTIERLNSILVVTRSPAVFQEVQRWIEKLDVPSSGTDIKTFVYLVENNTATNIASILSQLYQDGVGVPALAAGEVQEGQPQQTRIPFPEPGSVPSTQQDLQGLFRGSALGPSLSGRPMSSQSDIRAVVSGNIKIIVNEFNNSLIIQSTEAEYQFLLQTIKLLDVLPRQVLIEAKIFSVELRDELSYGVAWFLEGRAEDPGPSTIGSISTEGSLTFASRGFLGSDRQLTTIISALRAVTKVELLEAPRILALDGMQAQINIGAEIPVTTASFGNPLQAGQPSNFINSIQFRPTGVTLLIMPRISASGLDDQ